MIKELIWITSLLVFTSGKSYRADDGGIVIRCEGDVHHHQLLKLALQSYNNFEELDESSTTTKGILPQCILSSDFMQYKLSGTADITYGTLQNVAILLKNRFGMGLPNNMMKSDYFNVYATLFMQHSYFKSVANLCQAIKQKSHGLKCSFIDVTKNPIVLAKTPNHIPWIEIKTRFTDSPVIITDQYPNFWKYCNQIGIVNDDDVEKIQISSTTILQCMENECSHNSVKEPFLYSNDYWNKEISPHVPARVLRLSSTGIMAAPHTLLQILNDTTTMEQTNEIFYLVYTLLKDCASCVGALPSLAQLREQMRLDHAKIFYINCDDHKAICSKQKVTGFPTLLAYKTLPQPKSNICSKITNAFTPISYHGAFLSSHLIEWYQDINDMGLHFSEPHDFHEGCNVHFVVATSGETTDLLPLECLQVICKELFYAECFIIQENTDTDVYIESITLTRRDEVSSKIYEDGIPLAHSFTRNELLHQYHSDHHYNIPVCKDNPATCLETIRVFIKEHSRMPVTELTPMIFHSPTSYQPLFGDLPVLVALVTHEMILSSKFMELLEEISTRYYTDVATAFVDVDRYPMWVSGMSPKSSKPVPHDSWIYQYPRIIVFHLEDHSHAAFLEVTGEGLKKRDIEMFVEGYLKKMVREPCNGI